MLVPLKTLLKSSVKIKVCLLFVTIFNEIIYSEEIHFVEIVRQT
jgi:hypothetical protein